MRHRIILVGASVLVFLSVCIGLFLVHVSYSEVRTVAGTSWSEDEYTSYFTDLAKKRGAPYAFDVLRRVTLPADVNTHKVGHAVGDVLYEQKGIEGMSICTQDFRSACSHSVVIQALIENGIAALSEIRDACARAPGGIGAYAICFHGVGHGLVASSGYDFKRAVSLCGEISKGTAANPGRGHRFMDTEEECIGGAVMEMVQGVHDVDARDRMIPIYLPVEYPFRPCTDTYVPVSLRPACLLSLTQRFFGYAGIAEDLPLPDTYPEAMKVCALASDADERTACSGGFGKEFVFYATQFDGGDVNSLSDSALKNIWQWCAYATDSAGFTRCASVAVDSLFWAGLNNPESAVRFCAVSPNDNQAECYTELIEDVHYFSISDQQWRTVCALLPEGFQEECTANGVSGVLRPSTDVATIHI